MAQPFDNSAPDYITTKEAGWLFNRSDATIRRWCHRKVLRYRQAGTKSEIDVNFAHAVELAQLTVEEALAIIKRRRQQEQDSLANEGGTLPPGQLRHTAALPAA